MTVHFCFSTLQPSYSFFIVILLWLSFKKYDNNPYYFDKKHITYNYTAASSLKALTDNYVITRLGVFHPVEL